jgi:transcriptional regulator with XRE-family HTH domain
MPIKPLEILLSLGLQQKEIAAALKVTPQFLSNLATSKKPIPLGRMEDLWALAATTIAQVATGVGPQEACRTFKPVYRENRMSTRHAIPPSMLTDYKVAREDSDLTGTLLPMDEFFLASNLRCLLPYLDRYPESFDPVELEELRQRLHAILVNVQGLQSHIVFEACKQREGNADERTRENTGQHRSRHGSRDADA